MTKTKTISEQQCARAIELIAAGSAFATARAGLFQQNLLLKSIEEQSIARAHCCDVLDQRYDDNAAAIDTLAAMRRPIADEFFALLKTIFGPDADTPLHQINHPQCLQMLAAFDGRPLAPDVSDWPEIDGVGGDA